MLRFLPINELVPWPEDLFESSGLGDGTSVLDKLGVEDFHLDGSLVEVSLVALEEIVLGIPGFDGAAIVVGGHEGGTRFTTAINLANPFEVAVSTNISFRFPSFLLKPVELAPGGQGFEVLRDPATGKEKPYQIDLTDVTVKVDSNAEVDIEASEGAPSVSLPPAEIGETGLVFEGDNLTVVLSSEAADARGVPPDWRGIFIENAAVYLPPDLGVAVPSDIQLDDFVIGSGGFCGKITGNWTPQLNSDGSGFEGNGAGEIFGIPIAMREIHLEVTQNTFVESRIGAVMKLPFFDQPVACEIGLTNDGDFTVAISADQTLPSEVPAPTLTDDGLFVFTKQDLLKLKLRSIGFEKEAEVFSIQMGGAITPLFGGLPWPTVEVEALTIDSHGRVSIAGGWIDLPQQKTLDFHGFALEISKLGFGTEDDGSRWIGFSGGLKLCEGLPLSGAVEGLRVFWKGSDVWLEFSGAELAFEIPNSIALEGRVQFIEDPKEPRDPTLPKTRGFKGGGKLRVIPTGLEINAELVIGKNDRTPAYTFFYIFLDAQLPAGIPLGQTGVALYGLAGLFAYNMEPNKRPELEWYDGWYKGDPIGVSSSVKWDDARGSFALGAGITLGTATDNGFAVSAKTLLVLVCIGVVRTTGTNDFPSRR